MSIETNLFSALKTLVGNRVAPVIFPQAPAVPTWPAIRYSVQVTPVIDQCGDDDDDTAYVRVQLDAVAEDFDSARTLRSQIKARMKIFDPPALLEFSTSEYDEETKTFREILQYSIHGSTVGGSP